MLPSSLPEKPTDQLKTRTKKCISPRPQSLDACCEARKPAIDGGNAKRLRRSMPLGRVSLLPSHSSCTGDANHGQNCRKIMMLPRKSQHQGHCCIIAVHSPLSLSHELSRCDVHLERFADLRKVFFNRFIYTRFQQCHHVVGSTSQHCCLEYFGHCNTAPKASGSMEDITSNKRHGWCKCIELPVACSQLENDPEA